MYIARPVRALIQQFLQTLFLFRYALHHHDDIHLIWPVKSHFNHPLAVLICLGVTFKTDSKNEQWIIFSVSVKVLFFLNLEFTILVTYTKKICQAKDNQPLPPGGKLQPQQGKKLLVVTSLTRIRNMCNLIYINLTLFCHTLRR